MTVVTFAQPKTNLNPRWLVVALPSPSGPHGRGHHDFYLHAEDSAQLVLGGSSHGSVQWNESLVMVSPHSVGLSHLYHLYMAEIMLVTNHMSHSFPTFSHSFLSYEAVT